MAGIEALPFGVLIFVVGSLIVANAWAVVDAKVAVVAAAREAARTYVESTDPATGEHNAVQAAEDALAGHGRASERLDLDIDDPGGLRRCERVEVTARYPVPALTVPWVGSFGEGFVVRATHSEVVDPFRDGLSGAADCV
ncbi:hypothetical protein BH18ACT4_BH18ACT4_02470 [soil metagenome]